MMGSMDIENIEIRKAKTPPKGDDLQKGVVGLTLKSLGQDLRNIPYRVTKDKEVCITPPGLMYAGEKPKVPGEKIESVLVPTVSFHDPSIWDTIVQALQKEILSTLT